MAQGWRWFPLEQTPSPHVPSPTCWARPHLLEPWLWHMQSICAWPVLWHNGHSQGCTCATSLPASSSPEINPMSYLWHQSCTSVTLLHDVISEFNCSRGNGHIICLMDPLQLLYILLFSNRHLQNTSKTCILQPRTHDFQSLQILLWNEKMKKFYIFN